MGGTETVSKVLVAGLESGLLRDEALFTLPLNGSPDFEAKQISEFPSWLWAVWAAER